MIQQPLPGVSQHSGSKQCWACLRITPYHFGFCDPCWADIPTEVQGICNTELPQPWSGAIAGGIVSTLQALRSKPKIPTMKDLFS